MRRVSLATVLFLGVACSSPDLGRDAPGATDAGAPDADAPDAHSPEDVDAAACPSFDEPEKLASIQADALTETSGLVASQAEPGLFWANNDSGDTARLFALGSDGALRAIVTVEGATAVDWEDLAIAPAADGGEDLFAADIGDNAEARPFVTVYRVHAPALGPAYLETTASATPIELAYEDGRAHNAEALVVDPRSSAIVIVTKSEGPSTIFVAEPPFAPGARNVLHARGTLAFGEGALPGGKLVTGASITRDGALVAVRTYTSAFAWRRAEGQTVSEALLGEPCALPLASEIQGETIALFPGGEAFVTTTEGTRAPLSISRRR